MEAETTASSSEATEADTAPVLDRDERHEQAEALVRRNVLWSVGVGVVPLPLFDIVGITAVEVKMLRQLANLYDIPFREGLAKKIIGSLLLSIGGVSIGAAVGVSLLKFVPIVGAAFGTVSIPIVAGAITHSLGKIFIKHFEAGGTFLDFETDKMREFFREEFDKAKIEVQEIRKTRSSS